MSIKTDWDGGRARGRLGTGQPSAAPRSGSSGGSSGLPGSHAWLAPPVGLAARDLARWAIDGADAKLFEMARAVERGEVADAPLAAAAVRHALRHGQAVDPGPLLIDWYKRIRHASEGPSYVPWPTTDDDRPLLGPVATIEAAELLLTLAEDRSELVGERAAEILTELRPAIEDRLATSILVEEPRGDTLILWLLAHHPRSLETFHAISVAVAMRYAILVRRLDGLVYENRLGGDGRPIVRATAQLGVGLWSLGVYPTLIGRILAVVGRARESDGAWVGRDGLPDLVTTLVAADLLLGLDPDVDPEPTMTWLATSRDADGWWRRDGREAPWLTAAIRDWLDRASRPFVDRFAWPSAPKPARDRKTGLPRYEYLADLARALELVPSLADRRLEVAFCDLANFGTFNSTYGQAAGDGALAVFAATLQGELPGCRVVRDGGDEFVIVGPPTWSGLRAELDRFVATWPARFRDRFGDGPTMVSPRISGMTVRAASLLAAREALGLRIGALKQRVTVVPEGGVVDWSVEAGVYTP
jgi:GGDEF domain-containing protein